MVERVTQVAQFYEHLETQILRYFREVTSIGSVTGTEYRVFDWLLRKVFPEFADPATRYANKLDIRFVRGNQLLVSWNGASNRSAKRMIVVAHTDHEGFLVREQWIDTGGTKQLWVRAEDPGGGSVEVWHAGAEVQIAFGWRQEDARRNGKITQIVKSEEGEPDYAKVQVTLEKGEDPSGVLAEFKEHAWSLGVYPTFEDRADSGSGVRPNESLSVPFVDNCAGVAVATAVLRTIVDSDADVNLSVLYTTGEEAGFVGLLRMLEGSRLSEALLDAVWIVLDASSHAGSSQIGMQEWYGQRVVGMQKGENKKEGASCDEVKSGSRCPENVAAIRLEDRCTIFDYSAALLLYQASLLVKSKLGATQLRDKSWYKDIGVAGTFVKGECEATVLAHHAAFHEGHPKPHGLRVGALAIPVVNYRNYAGFNLGAMKPEVTRIGALTSAGFILVEACSIVSRTHLINAVEPRARDSNA
ncbi:MAG TPA: hypothetical protein VGC79_07890, partial [Polyangiaceae bacterium]